MGFQNIVLDIEDGIALLCVNRPQALNALNQETLLEIGEAVKSVSDDPQVDVLIITGAGERAFVAGADIRFMEKLTPLEARAFGRLGQEVFRSIELMEKPSIAAVNGYALGGGCELALCCDIRIASIRAKFGQPEVSLGIIPGFGGTQRLARIIGPGMAKQILFSAQPIDAIEAHRIGLVNQIVASDDLMTEAYKIARQIQANSQMAVKLCKSAVNQGLQTDIDRGMEIEADLFGICFSSDDQKEGMNAFIVKRNPRFTGK